MVIHNPWISEITYQMTRPFIKKRGKSSRLCMQHCCNTSFHAYFSPAPYLTSNLNRYDIEHRLLFFSFVNVNRRTCHCSAHGAPMGTCDAPPTGKLLRDWLDWISSSTVECRWIFMHSTRHQVEELHKYIITQSTFFFINVWNGLQFMSLSTYLRRHAIQTSRHKNQTVNAINFNVYTIKKERR